MSMRHGLAAVALLALTALSLHDAASFPLSGDQTVLPAASELNEDALDRPREVFRSESLGGFRSYLVDLGDLAFNSPTLLGGTARQAAIRCATCHVNGAGNARLYIPGMSSRPGTFDTTGPLFNPKAHNGVLDPVRIPSLRGIRTLGPYGSDGRIASLREFIRNVVVNEFAGAEPSPTILDALVAYIEDIDFLPNPSIGPTGRLTSRSNAAERRGEAIFSRPFPHDAQLSCAACHVPSGGFVDHRQHSVGSGGWFKTPTLLNADFNAPYFHDGRYDTFDQVVAHFDRVFDLKLSVQDSADLVAYLKAVGDGLQPYERDGVTAQLREISGFARVLETAIAARDVDVIAMAVSTVGQDLRELAEQFPDHRNLAANGGVEQRLAARRALKDAVMTMRRIGVASSEGRFDDAARDYDGYRRLSFAALPLLLRTAEPWSLFNPAVHQRHFSALRQMLQPSDTRPLLSTVSREPFATGTNISPEISR